MHRYVHLHLLFSILGEWVSIAGGTLLQLLIPGGLAIAFFCQGQPYSGSVMLMWHGQNFFGISVYIRDARTQALPLVGGEIHDSGYLLGKAGLLAQDQIIGKLVWVMGLVVVGGALFLSTYTAGKTLTRACPHS